MGSRIMHYCISTILAEKMDLEDKSTFILGGIAPDIHGLMGVPKAVTHFKDRDSNGKGFINYPRFYETYKDKMNQPFYLGYLCHLISDAVWLDMYFTKVKMTTKEQWKKDLETCYRDFQRLNERIITLYSLQLQQYDIPQITIEGYDTAFLPTLLELLAEDFQINHDLVDDPLELFDNDNGEIIDFIKKSVGKSLDFLHN